MLAMKKEEVFIDLSKCSEEQIKVIPQILEKAGQEIYFLAKPTLLSGKLDMFYPYLVFSRPSSNVWVFSHNKPDRTELAYPEFIKLFEVGEGEIIPDVAYWRYRCLLAEKCLSVSPCDSDITDEQISAHKAYNQFLNTFGNKD